MIPSSPPTNTAAPTVTGTAQRTFTLIATQGTWAGIGNTYTYQWQHDTGSGYVDIVGQTGTTYALGVPDEGTTVRVLITATNADGTATKASAPTATVLAAAPHNTVAPTLTGTPQRGLLLTGTLGTWDGIGNAYAYQWQRSVDGTTWTTITGATNPTYTLAVADEGAQVRVQVTATNVDGSAISSSPATVSVTGGAPVNLTPPTFAGAPQRAVRLAVTSNGNWAGIGNTLTRQWQRSADGGQTWTNIVGQTDGSYTLTVADEGAVVRLLVTATNADGATGAAERPERDGDLCAGAQYDAARRHRDAAAERDADRHAWAPGLARTTPTASSGSAAPTTARAGRRSPARPPLPIACSPPTKERSSARRSRRATRTGPSRRPARRRRRSRPPRRSISRRPA